MHSASGLAARNWSPPSAVVVATLPVAVAGGVAVALGGLPVVAALLAVPVVLVALYSAGIAFALYLLVPAFLKGALQPYVPVDLTVALGAVCLLHIASGLLSGRRLHASPLLVWLAPFVMIIGGALYAPDQGLAIDRIAEWGALVFLPLLVAFWVASEPRELERFVWAFLAIGLVMVALALPAWTTQERLNLDFTTTIGVGRAVLMVPLIVFSFALPMAPRWARPLLVGVVPLAIVVALATGSRGPLLMFVVTVLAIGVWNILRGRGAPMKALAVGGTVLLASLVAVLLVGLPAATFERIDYAAALVTTGEAGNASDGIRLALIDVAGQMFVQSPFIGSGTGAFTFVTDNIPLLVDQRYPHNVILELAADWGLVGVMLFATMVVIALRSHRPSTPAWTAVWVLFVFALATQMLGNVFTNRAFWGLLLLLVVGGMSTLGRVRPRGISR